jgi:hypothetical protein
MGCTTSTSTSTAMPDMHRGSDMVRHGARHASHGGVMNPRCVGQNGKTRWSAG